jgi:nucleotide-binding universal stress UspA family protein
MQRVRGTPGGTRTVKDLIVVHVENSAQCARRIDLAVRLAQTFKARIVGVYAEHPAVMPVGEDSLYGIEAGAMSAAEHLEYNAQVAHTDAQAAEQAYRSHMPQHMVTAHWYTMAGSAADVVVAYARYADLAIVSQPPPGGGEDTAAEVALRAGRPVLVAPHLEHFPVSVERVLVAWDASREAARALNDALPLLGQAKQVTLLSIGPAEKMPPGVDIGEHLKNHGIEASLVQEHDTGVDVGHAVLARAGELSCDLIVMGAYGHSPLRERVLGGTTRHVLKHMTVPVLVAH